MKTEENITNILNTDTNDLVLKDFQSVRRRGKGSSLKVSNVKSENNNINISPYVVKSEIKNKDSDKAINLVNKFDTTFKAENNQSNKSEKKEKINENLDKFNKIDSVKEESNNQDLKKSQEENEKKSLTLNNIPEKNNDLDFENKNLFLKNSNSQNNRPFSRKRSAFKCLEEIEKDINNTPKNTINEKVNYLHTVNSIINDDISNNKNNNPSFNNLNNFNKLINNTTQKLMREKKPDIKNLSTYNKITVPSFSSNINSQNKNYQNSISNNKDNTVFNDRLINNEKIQYSENSNKNYIGAYSINNLNASTRKPENETRRRKLINSNNNITGVENDFNLNQTAANPTSNNLIIFENQIKNTGGNPGEIISNNNILNKIDQIGRMNNHYNDNKGFMDVPITIKDNSGIYSLMNNTNSINSNPMSITKYSNQNSRIESRRVTTNAGNNIINHSYFGTTDKNLSSTKDKESNKKNIF